MAVRLMYVNHEASQRRIFTEGETPKIVGTVWADTKEEIVPNLTIDGDQLDYGSVAITKDFKVAQLGEDGEWVWKEQGGTL